LLNGVTSDPLVVFYEWNVNEPEEVVVWKVTANVRGIENDDLGTFMTPLMKMMQIA